MLKLSEFTIEKVICELRYPMAYRLWDLTGAIWEEAAKKWPEMTPANVEPSHTVFTLKNKWEFSVQPDKSFVAETLPSSSLKTFIEKCDPFSQIVVRHLQPAHFVRVGLRIQYYKEFKDKDSARKAVRESGLVNITTPDLFGARADDLGTELTLRWDSGKRGATARLKSEVRTLEISDFSIFQIPAMRKELACAIYDIDYFVSGLIPVGQLKPEEWIASSLQAIKNDSEKVLEGR